MGDENKVVISQEELSKREPTHDEQVELERRIEADEELFDDVDKKDEDADTEDNTDDDKNEDKEDEDKKEGGDDTEDEDESSDDEDNDDSDEGEPEENADDDQSSDKKQPPTEEEKLEAIATEYSKSNNISMDEAKELVKKEKAIIEKYENDPHKIARAYRNIQKVSSQKEEEARKLSDELEQLRFESAINSRNFSIEAVHKAMTGKETSREAILRSYRDNFPKITEDRDDEEVYEMAKKDYIIQIQTNRKTSVEKMKTDASKKRQELLVNLDPSLDEFKPDISELVESAPDSMIMDPKFNLNDAILWSKGNAYDTLKDTMEKKIKDAEEAGYKRGIEQRKVLGNKQPSGGTKKSDNKKSKGQGLTDAQKQAALNMFETDPIPVEKKYELYKEVIEHDQKLKDAKKKDK